jgi:hypothetical protein
MAQVIHMSHAEALRLLHLAHPYTLDDVRLAWKQQLFAVHSDKTQVVNPDAGHAIAGLQRARAQLLRSLRPTAPVRMVPWVRPPDPRPPAPPPVTTPTQVCEFPGCLLRVTTTPCCPEHCKPTYRAVPHFKPTVQRCTMSRCARLCVLPDQLCADHLRQVGAGPINRPECTYVTEGVQCTIRTRTYPYCARHWATHYRPAPY